MANGISTSLLAISLALSSTCTAASVKLSAPQMGWNSYNYYSCAINESIIADNAKALVDTGLSKLGYQYVTPDCGWFSGLRDSDGALAWNLTRFPSGGQGLGDIIHGYGLKFGVYTDAGYWQCGSLNQFQGSLGFEKQDATAFARWGADSLKYDNCYNTNTTVGADFYSEESGSSQRFRTMGHALAEVDRDLVYQLCQWGVGHDLGSWASGIANSWRISVDIYNNWGSIWRILNQVIPFAKLTTAGSYPDMDMLIVGLGVLSKEEEKMHFGLWSIFKSPLILGNSIANPISPDSLAVISNQEVIAINQDPLGESAQLVRRSEKGYDIYAGKLSGGRMVLSVANWLNSSQTVTFNISQVLGIQSASARNVWAYQDVGELRQTYQTELAGHEMQILVLSDIEYAQTVSLATSYHVASEAIISGNATVVQCALGQCLPAQSKVASIGNGSANAAVTFTNIYSDTDGERVVGVDFINYDIAWESSWKKPQGTSSRNLTMSVNSGPLQQWSFPISGGNWFDSGRLVLDVDGFVKGVNNTLIVKAADGGMSGMAPDLVGIELFG
ncbi:hypothetical protein PFICI_12024 [Pestalotiopsis fici W106-1]|uniref:Alpha-galactosidase n=1 Tax=Pestalotiopsis fici (strain W106-1 / CGMCC3.15140) TaxID=1229662 RepID=W3WU00_PESFW|nr:uncharacterized protein PFICI_12024 [Pestalotiopsis fici W106-1]ETS76637.1 hypothetical protein PFICI_12024 [Pestalotiopsis fici W106-1]